LVVGDVNSTAAGALAAATLGIPIAPVEAGLRSFDRSMPEEINRILTDSVSELLFASESSGVTNLIREGHDPATIHHVGNVMIDALVRFRAGATRKKPAGALGIAGPYGVLTLHRPSNVDDPFSLKRLLSGVGDATRHLPIIFPVHPRTRHRLDAPDFPRFLEGLPKLYCIAPLGYLDMLALLQGATLVLTDSGGVQEETTFLGVPCLTLRDTTERPATVTEGTNLVIGSRPSRLLTEVERILDGHRPAQRCPALWDGHAAEQVVDVLVRWAGGRQPAATGMA
jgi:UDP-N-acetylglucosamine 2-epimerase (non-hydrolysing)